MWFRADSTRLTGSFDLIYFYYIFFPLTFNQKPVLFQSVVSPDMVDVTWLQWNATSRNLLPELIGQHRSGKAVNKGAWGSTSSPTLSLTSTYLSIQSANIYPCTHTHTKCDWWNVEPRELEVCGVNHWNCQMSSTNQWSENSCCSMLLPSYFIQYRRAGTCFEAC